MVTSRMALEDVLQNRLTTDAFTMQASAADLFRLYAGKHHADDTSTSSYGAETAIKREVHTPTTDHSEDSGVDVSATAAATTAAVAAGTDARRSGGGGGGRVTPHKRKRSDDRGGCPTAVKSSRTEAAAAAAAVLSVNMAMVVAGGKAAAGTQVGGSPPPFRPWSSDEAASAADVGLRLFHDIRNVDRILTLTQRRRGPSPPPQPPSLPPPPPPPEPQPLDLTNGGSRRQRQAAAAAAAAAVPPDSTAAAAAAVRTDSSAAAVPTAAPTADDGTACSVATTSRGDAATGTRYGKNMSRARRIEANARERSRVHTISAAFDTLRANVPSYSRNQKLSKLSTIRIASAYILTLSRLLDLDYSAEQVRPSVSECVNNITGIVHMEGKAKKRKDEQ